MTDLSEWTGKNALMTKDGKTVEVRIEGASQHGIAYKEVGSRNLQAALPNEVTLAPVPPKVQPIKQRSFMPITEVQARSHMALYHGLTIEEVNAMSPAEAYVAHEQIDHKQLGHNHDSVPS